jgi:hypothetical protein
VGGFFNKEAINMVIRLNRWWPLWGPKSLPAKTMSLENTLQFSCLLKVTQKVDGEDARAEPLQGAETQKLNNSS